jgi:GntP family gluconate:H+ symporter
MEFAFALASILVSIGVLLVLIVRFKVHPFIAMVSVAVVLAIVFGIPLVGDKGILHVRAGALGPPLAHILPLVGLGCIVGEICPWRSPHCPCTRTSPRIPVRWRWRPG